MMEVSKRCTGEAAKSEAWADGDESRDQNEVLEGRRSRKSKASSGSSHSRMAPDGREADGDGRSIARGTGPATAREHDERVKAIDNTRFHQAKPLYEVPIAFPGCYRRGRSPLTLGSAGKDAVPTSPTGARARGKQNIEHTSHG